MVGDIFTLIVNTMVHYFICVSWTSREVGHGIVHTPIEARIHVKLIRHETTCWKTQQYDQYHDVDVDVHFVHLRFRRKDRLMPLLFSDEALAVSTIWQEARGEPFLGKLAVAHVIRNRTLRKYNSDGTVGGTVLSPYQFSGWNTKDPNRVSSVGIDTDDTVVDACRTAWLLANQKGIGDKFPAVLFHASTMTEYPDWSKSTSVKKIAEIGNHIFYTDET